MTVNYGVDKVEGSKLFFLPGIHFLNKLLLPTDEECIEAGRIQKEFPCGRM